MQKAAQSLGVVDRLFPEILTGEKTSTIRWRERHIVPGPLKFICDGDAGSSVEVEVIRCTEMPLSEAAAFVGKADEWPGHIMLEGMREHYPLIELFRYRSGHLISATRTDMTCARQKLATLPGTFDEP